MTGRDTYALAFSRGDMLREGVERVAEEEIINFAEVSAIGAVEDPELGYYDLAEKKYVRRAFPGVWELLSLKGNVTLVDGKSFLHAHVAIGGRDFSVFGGHLFDARVAAVVEMFMRDLSEPMERVLDERLGLRCWSIEE